jgi:hypothetical protein
MATRIVRTCDRHGAKGEDDIPGDIETVGLDGKWYAADLCPDCNAELLSAVREFFAEYGTPVDPNNPGRPLKGKSKGLNAAGGNLSVLLSRQRMGRPPTGGRTLQCLWCPLTYAGDSALNKHAEAEHGVKGGSKAIYGRRCPLCGEDGYDVIGAHVKRSHTDLVKSTNGAFVLAAENGDPYGVVATQLAQAKWHEGGLKIATSK